MSTDKETLNKLKRVLKVSNSIKMEQMRDMLDLDTKTFNKKILDWAEEFDFILDRDYIIINKNTVESFINQLDKQFEAWDKMETTKIGKVEGFESNNVVQLEAQSLKVEEEDLEAKNNLEKEAEKKARREAIERENKSIVINAQQKFNKRQWNEAINLFKKSKEICSQQGWSDGISYAEKMILEAEEKIREAEERAKKILPFKGTQISQFEADILQELENQLNKQFNFVTKFEERTKMGFCVENNQITGIGLYDCDISILPESISNLKSLQKLELSANKLTTLPESIGNLSSLEELEFNDNKCCLALIEEIFLHFLLFFLFLFLFFFSLFPS